MDGHENHQLVFNDIIVGLIHTDNVCINAKQTAIIIKDTAHFVESMNLLIPEIDFVNNNTNTYILTECGFIRYVSKFPSARELLISVVNQIKEFRDLRLSDAYVVNELLEKDQAMNRDNLLANEHKLKCSDVKLSACEDIISRLSISDFQKNLDTTHVELAFYCIAKTFARYKNLMSNLDKYNQYDLSNSCYEKIANIAYHEYDFTYSAKDIQEKIDDLILEDAGKNGKR